MISSKAIELLKSFSEAEFKEFGLFAASPYFNRENVQVKFYEILKKHYPDFSSRTFTKEQIYKKLYPGKTFSDGVMRNILSKTLELAENFISIQHFQKDEFTYSYTLMRELSKRKAEKLFIKAETLASST